MVARYFPLSSSVSWPRADGDGCEADAASARVGRYLTDRIDAPPTASNSAMITARFTRAKYIQWFPVVCEQYGAREAGRSAFTGPPRSRDDNACLQASKSLIGSDVALAPVPQVPTGIPSACWTVSPTRAT